MVAAIMIGRKGSKGFPGKNTHVVGGKPMCEWPLLAAQRVVDKIYYSTDDEDVHEIAKRYGERIPRPPELATDEALGEDVYAYCAARIQSPLLVLLMANSPCVSRAQIEEGVNAVSSGRYKSACTVSKYNMFHPTRARNRGDSLYHYYLDGATCDRNSSSDAWFYDCGCAVVRRVSLSEMDNGLPPQRWLHAPCYGIENEAGIDVDYEWQIGQVEWWLKKHGMGDTGVRS